MTRVRYVEGETSEIAPLVQRIRAGRGSLLKLYKVLLHSPAVAETWLNHISALRTGTYLSGRLRELVIVRVAHLTGTAYVLKQHVPLMAEAEGVSAAECAGLADWPAMTTLSPAERAALAYADAMTLAVRVPVAVHDALVPFFGDRARVELSVLVASYNMHVRVVQALDIDVE